VWQGEILLSRISPSLDGTEIYISLSVPEEAPSLDDTEGLDIAVWPSSSLAPRYLFRKKASVNDAENCHSLETTVIMLAWAYFTDRGGKFYRLHRMYEFHLHTINGIVSEQFTFVAASHKWMKYITDFYSANTTVVNW
jgi:hypothetical protein